LFSQYTIPQDKSDLNSRSCVHIHTHDAEGKVPQLTKEGDFLVSSQRLLSCEWHVVPSHSVSVDLKTTRADN